MWQNKRGEYYNKWKEENREKFLAYQREYAKNKREAKKIYDKEYYEKNREVISEKMKEYRENNKEIIKEQQKIRTARFRKKNKERLLREEAMKRIVNHEQIKETQRRSRLKVKYNFTPEQYEDLCIQQDYKCSICKKLSNNLYIDHCHKTKKVRGLLCNKCNLGLGHFKDNQDLLLSASQYLSHNFSTQPISVNIEQSWLNYQQLFIH